MSRLTSLIKKLPPVRALMMLAHKTKIPRSGGLSLLGVYRFFKEELKRNNLMLRANSMAFSFFLSLFPLLIIAITIFSYLPSANADSLLESSLSYTLPESARQFMQQIMAEFQGIKRGGVLSVSFLITIFFSSNGMINLMRGFDKKYSEIFKKRSGLKRRGIALFLTLCMSTFLLLSLLLIVLGSSIIRKLFDIFQLTNFAYIGIEALKWITIFVLFYSIIAILYRVGPALKKKIAFYSAGTFVAAILSIISSVALSYFANKFGAWNKVYGSISAVILIMIWLQINSIILLIGYELNASILIGSNQIKTKKKRRAEMMEPEDAALLTSEEGHTEA